MRGRAARLHCMGKQLGAACILAVLFCSFLEAAGSQEYPLHHPSAGCNETMMDGGNQTWNGSWDGAVNLTGCSTLVVCSGHGILEEDGCHCDLNFGGSLCSKCALGYFGDQCMDTCDPVQNCSAHGRCTFDGQCECSAGFAGPHCSLCAEGNMYGDNCDIFCDEEQTCGGHGRCLATGACECDESFDGEFCSLCTNARLGLDCEVKCDAEVVSLLGYVPVLALISPFTRLEYLRIVYQPMASSPG